ncbi:MAG: ABC transporter ATP-binding protein [Candidatus Heimdallarchaeota archaeon]|nr:ABC transporter ATP-binding protein [Candidatus Heimdallarchaeota archaeon]
MFRKSKKEQADIIVWSVFCFNPIAERETENFKAEIIKGLRKLKPLSYHFEEMTAFLILRIHLHSTTYFMNNPFLERTPNDETLALKTILSNLHELLAINYEQYLQMLKKRFLKEIKRNRELKETTSILSKKLQLTEDEKNCFVSIMLEKIKDKTDAYYSVLKKASLFLGGSLTNNISYLIFSQKETELTIKKSLLPLLDELILYNFSPEYAIKTQIILKEFIECIKKVNQKLKLIGEKSPDLMSVLDLLKGKSFEVLDDLYELRRQIARLNRVENEIDVLTKEFTEKDFSKKLSELKVKKKLKTIVRQTDQAITALKRWYEHLRKIDLLKDLQENTVTIDKKFSDQLCDLFVKMELLRIWSEFFYDISYYTIKKGRALAPIEIEEQKTIETDAVLVVKDVYKTYKLPKSRVYALRGISLEIHPGEFVAIMGPSGAGKTTLVNILTGLDTPDRGALYLNGKNISIFDDTELTTFRRDKIGLVFQFYQLFPELTALENVALPAEMANVPVKKAREKALEKLAVVDLSDFVNQYPDKLSGGQQQRVAIARALVNDPSIIVADQLTGDLDSVTGMQIIGYLRKINKERGTTILLVTHNKAVAMQADRILTIEDGEIIEEIDMARLRASD